jgi:hypothetical protein
VNGGLVARGTRWFVVISLLRRCYSDLGPEIDSLGLPTVELGEMV